MGLSFFQSETIPDLVLFLTPNTKQQKIQEII